MPTDASIAFPAIDPRQLRDTLGCFPTGVAVVTADAAAGHRIGLTITSFNAVSLDPPLILFSIGRQCLSLPALVDAPHYSVNILGEAHQEISTRFATARGDKWRDVEIECHAGLPFTLGAAIATFQCAQHAQHDGGDHIIFVGRVLRAARQDSARPLVFHRGAYRALAAAG